MEKGIDYWKQRAEQMEQEAKEMRPVVDAVRELKYSTTGKMSKLKKLYAALDKFDKGRG